MTNQDDEFERKAEEGKSHSTIEIAIAYVLVVVMILFILMSLIATRPGVTQ